MFVPTLAFNTDQLQSLLETIIPRILRCLVRRGFIAQESNGETQLADDTDWCPFNALQWASCTYRIVFGPNAGNKLLTTSTGSNDSLPPMCAAIHGFTLHVATRFDSHQRDALERLCQYVTRPPIANERLSIDNDGQVVLQLKTPYRDGTSAIRLTPIEFMGRLAALVPRPWINLIRYHGVFAPNAKWRSAIVPRSTPPDSGQDSSNVVDDTDHRSEWAELLKRIFLIDALKCPFCAGPMKRIATITDPVVIRKILDHLQIMKPRPPPAQHQT